MLFAGLHSPRNQKETVLTYYLVYQIATVQLILLSCKAHVFMDVLLVHDMGATTIVASYSVTGALGW